LDYFLHKGIPLIAGRTFAQPFGRFIATFLAKENGFGFGHTARNLGKRIHPTDLQMKNQTWFYNKQNELRVWRTVRNQRMFPTFKTLKRIPNFPVGIILIISGPTFVIPDVNA
jgi:hypothetical protein